MPMKLVWFCGEFCYLQFDTRFGTEFTTLTMICTVPEIWWILESCKMKRTDFISTMRIKKIKLKIVAVCLNLGDNYMGMIPKICALLQGWVHLALQEWTISTLILSLYNTCTASFPDASWEKSRQLCHRPHWISESSGAVRFSVEKHFSVHFHVNQYYLHCKLKYNR